MSIVVFQDIHKSFPSGALFRGLNLTLYAGQKVGLVGPNGCGKTTLFKMILGQETPDLGQVSVANGLQIGYLPQEPTFNGHKTVLEEMHDGVADLLAIWQRLEWLAEQMANPKGSNTKAVLNEYDRLKDAFQAAGGYRYESNIKATLAGLGFSPDLYDLKTCQLSGGQASRLGLAKVLVKQTNLLLLDEPTNHLDLAAVEWLEHFLKNYDGAAVIISHDRYLLDRVAEKIIEIENLTARVWKGNYTHYLDTKAIVQIAQQRQQEKRAAFVARTLDFIARNKDQEGMRGTARGRKKRLARLLDENPDFLQTQTAPKTIRLQFVPSQAKNDWLIRATKLAKSFDGRRLFENIDFELTPGMCLGITGANGTGKTTLLRILLGQIVPDRGMVQRAANIRIGYLDQQAETLDPSRTVFDEARAAAPQASPQQIRDRLAAFLFVGDEVFKPVKDLSGGQQNRLMLCKLTLQAPDVLVLDEPTNHLDIPSRQALEEALADFNGAVVAVSHDRYFLDSIATQLLVLGVESGGMPAPGQHLWIRQPLEGTDGVYSTFAMLAQQTQTQIAAAASSASPAKAKSAAAHPSPKTRTPEHLKPFNKYTLEHIEQTINQLEQQLEQLQLRYAEPRVYQNPAALAELKTQIQAEKANLDLWYQAWEWRLSQHP